jgi:hypothetical protein
MAGSPGRFGHRGEGKGRKQGPSFSEEKEAKRLFTLARAPDDRHACEKEKVFWFFFSKKNVLTFFEPPRSPTAPAWHPRHLRAAP